MNPRIRSLAWTHIVLNGLCLVGGIALCVSLIPSNVDVGKASEAFQFIGALFLGLAAFYFVPGLVGGWGLLNGRPWARTLLIVESVLLILAFPLGTMLGVWGLIVLLKTEFDPRIASGASARPAQAPGQPHPQRGLLMAAAGVGAGFIVMIGTGFRMSGDAYQPIGPVMYYGAIGVLASLLVLLVRAISTGQWPARSVQATAGPYGSDHQQLVFSRRPADRMDESLMTDSPLGTCVHLQPIEQQMLSEGILIGRVTRLQVRAYCVIDQAALRHRFQLAKPVDYVEPGYGGAGGDLPESMIACEHCRSVIEAVHREDAVPTTPIFPKAGG